MEPLGAVLTQLSSGGGASSINIEVNHRAAGGAHAPLPLPGAHPLLAALPGSVCLLLVSQGGLVAEGMPLRTARHTITGARVSAAAKVMQAA